MSRSKQQLEQENAQLRERLADAEGVLHAIRQGEVDAVVVDSAQGERIFTLEGADHTYRVLVESMNEGAATLTSDGVVLYANHRLAELLGTSAAQLNGTRLASWLDPAEATRYQELLCASGDGAVAGELTALKSDGARLPIHASLSPLELRGVRLRCAIVTDISLLKHHAALETAERQVRDANERLRDADRRKDEFLATLAHELRNPLAPIRAAAHVIKVLALEDERLSKAQGMIERQVAHMARLVDDLLEVSRITLGRIELQRGTESLAALLASVTEAAQPSIDKAQHVLSIELPDEPLLIEADNVRLSQAISNVLDNAVKYTPPGGRITLSVSRDAGEAVISVRDTGIGISPGALPRVFDLFMRVDRNQQRTGLGIGLALSRRLIEMHGGTIQVSSPGEGRGTEFTIRLPLSPDGSTERDDHVASALPCAGPAQRVLIVDDNVDAAESLRLSLELAGHVVKAEHGGTAALQAVVAFQPDVVVLDLNLPDLDGYEVARRIRMRQGEQYPTVIALSGWGQAEDKQRAAAAGCDAHFTKPIDPSVLAHLLAARSAGRLTRGDRAPERIAQGDPPRQQA